MALRSPLQAPTLLRLREPEVRDLCSGTAFSRGDAWQRAGQVENPAVYTDGLSAEVRGSWRQVTQVRATADAKGLHTSCSCGAGEFCRHAAALLLQWVRAPQSFRAVVPESYGDPPSLEEAFGQALDALDEGEDWEGETDGLASLLEMHSMTDLREMARLRGVRGGGRNKVELAATLAVSLADPQNIDAALEMLAQDERVLLQVLDLIELEAHVGDAVGTAYLVLSGESDLTKFAWALGKLVKLGLIFPSDDWSGPASRYIVPDVVAARLSLTGSRLLHLIQSMGRTNVTASPAVPTGLSLSEVFIVVVHDVLQGRSGQNPPTRPPGATSATPSGWMRGQPHAVNSKGRSGRPQSSEVTLIPPPSLLSDSDLQDLAERTGGSPEMIDFAVELLDELDVLTYTGQGKDIRLSADARGLYSLLRLPPSIRTVLLADTWQSMVAAFDFRGMTLRGKQLELQTVYLPYHSPLALSEPRSPAVRVLMIRLLARLAVDDPADRWYDLPAWLDLLWTLVPELLGRGSMRAGEWWFGEASGQGSRLNLEDRAAWQEIWEPLIRSMLLGPMTWLGLVDATQGPDGTLLFRPRPEAALLLQEPPEEEAAPLTVPPLVLEVDPRSGAPEVMVPARYPDLILHFILAATTDLADISPHGLRYRLSRQRALEAFETGGTGPDLLRLLEERSGGSVPDEMRSVLDAWWTEYGKVRLYDDLTLIELDDDILLQELLATSSLRGALVEVITPRLVSVEPSAVATLLGEMERLGYTPRLVEDA